MANKFNWINPTYARKQKKKENALHLHCGNWILWKFTEKGKLALIIVLHLLNRHCHWMKTNPIKTEIFSMVILPSSLLLWIERTATQKPNKVYVSTAHWNWRENFSLLMPWFKFLMESMIGHTDCFIDMKRDGICCYLVTRIAFHFLFQHLIKKCLPLQWRWILSR